MKTAAQCRRSPLSLLSGSGRSVRVEERTRYDWKLLEVIKQMDGLLTFEARLVMMPDHGPEDDIIAGSCRMKRSNRVARLQFFVRAKRSRHSRLAGSRRRDRRSPIHHRLSTGPVRPCAGNDLIALELAGVVLCDAAPHAPFARLVNVVEKLSLVADDSPLIAPVLRSGVVGS